ncbi:hypothetical protein NUW58_g2692 [Xylaria curta]|uniref:Uncharacterized protein n=1 Tax=Xylaria curta TaxID=42375 RepID=A0ACC1PEB2_9PEZI|nr:hypothetical protein NUW58_g2692 [Xylaria curta]
MVNPTSASAAASASIPVEPTFHGFISTTMDVLVLLEACLTGELRHIPRRPHDRERQQLIRSGSIFIYEEHSSGVKRWTDGLNWSPSRILGNFLIYRETVEEENESGEKKRAKRRKGNRGVTKSSSSKTPPSRQKPMLAERTAEELAAIARENDENKFLIGSLVDSYDFKKSGLVKKTVSVEFQGVIHHLVSYYTVDDVKSGRMQWVVNAAELRGIRPRHELLSLTCFRGPIEDCGLNVMDPNMARNFMFSGNPSNGIPMVVPQAPPTSSYMPSQTWVTQSYDHSSNITYQFAPQQQPAPMQPHTQQQQPAPIQPHSQQQQPALMQPHPQRYHDSQVLQTPTTTYTQVPLDYPFTFTASPQLPAYHQNGQILPEQHNSSVSSPNGIVTVQYSSPLLPDGCVVPTHGLSQFDQQPLYGVSPVQTPPQSAGQQSIGISNGYEGFNQHSVQQVGLPMNLNVPDPEEINYVVF